MAGRSPWRRRAASSSTLLLCCRTSPSPARWLLVEAAAARCSSGPFAKEFSDLGVAVHIGQIGQLLARVRDVRLAVCNTIMTAHLVLKLSERGIPAVWILHEWWPPEMMVEELGKRNDKNTTPDVVAAAVAACPYTVCVCRSQLERRRAARIVGVPSQGELEGRVGARPSRSAAAAAAAATRWRSSSAAGAATGIWRRPAAHLPLPRHRLPAEEPAVDGRKCSGDAHRRAPPRRRRAVPAAVRDRVRREGEGARGGRPARRLHDVTNDVDKYYSADVMLFASLNHADLAEAMIRQAPSSPPTSPGSPRLTHKTHGFVLPPGSGVHRRAPRPRRRRRRLRRRIGASPARRGDLHER